MIANYLLYPVVELKGFILLSVAAMALLTVYSFALLERKKKGLGSFGIQGLFLGRDWLELCGISLGILEVVYVLAMIVFPTPMRQAQLGLLAFLCLARGLAAASPAALLSELIYGVMEGAALMAGSLLLDYMDETGFDWYIMTVRVLLCAFLIQYSIYHFIKGVERMLRRDERER